jgi:hypothetical protein|tara:strand:+ start:1519 stop:1878 length:360 start_codon:yes stop_codon:yes gene_type:complete
MAEKSFETRAVLGLGEAINRLIRVEMMHASGYGGVPTDLMEERRLIVEALNQQYQLDLGFDCNMDGVPDTIEIFMQSAQTSCCRIIPMGPAQPKPSKKRTGSRANSTKNRPKRASRKKG